MIDDNDFYTETMAQVYVSQGYLEKAADIYTYLLEREPDRKDFIEKLHNLKEKMGAEHHTGKEHLASLFNEWVDLVLKHNKLKKLKKVSQAVSRMSRHLSDK